MLNFTITSILVTFVKIFLIILGIGASIFLLGIIVMLILSFINANFK